MKQNKLVDPMVSTYEERVLDDKLWCRPSPEHHWMLVPYEIVMGRMLLAERNVDRLIAQLKDKTHPQRKGE